MSAERDLGSKTWVDHVICPVSVMLESEALSELILTTGRLVDRTVYKCESGTQKKLKHCYIL